MLLLVGVEADFFGLGVEGLAEVMDEFDDVKFDGFGGVALVGVGAGLAA